MIARVIHIEGDKETYKHECDSFGIKYSLFNGVVRDHGYEGVSESFKGVIRESFQLDSVLIFEDDIKFTSKYSRSNWNICLDSIPYDWDILLGGSYYYENEERIKNGLIKLKDFSSLHCALIRNTCYEHILNHDVSNPNTKHLDRYLGSLSKKGIINVYLCDPQISIQHNGFSRTRNKTVNYDHLLINKNILYD